MARRRRRHHKKVGSKRGYLIRAARHSKAASASHGKKREGHLMIAKGYRVAAGGSSHSSTLHLGRKRRKSPRRRSRKKGRR